MKSTGKNTITIGVYILLSVFLGVARCAEDLSFPPGFKFGAASAAYQIEGAWNVSDKGESIWDRFTHTHPEIIADHSNGDVACDSYHLWKKDIEILKNLGLHFYRFSISWPRLLPKGSINYISEDGKEYYNNLINNLLAEGIEPVVTMYHFDLPQTLQDLGGWTNPFIVDMFADYARLLYTLYGDRVKIWLTINEPLTVCDVSYDAGFLAPGIISPEIGAYLCSKYILLAHAKAYRIYDKEFRAKYHGEVSIVNHLLWFQPESKDHESLTNMLIENSAGKYSHPIYSKEGGWPPGIESAMAENSKARGYSRSTFPALTQEEIDLIKGTYDFYALNHYTSRIVRKAIKGEALKPWPLGDSPDYKAVMTRLPEWKSTASSWFYVYPPGIRRYLVWLKKRYGNMKFFIAENGYASSVGLNDKDRIDYYESYLKQILLAIKDGVNVTHYTAWALFDNYEWMDGYTSRFGLYEVNFTDPMRTRTPRASAYYYANVVKTHSLNVPKL